ncbi:hypothetical protein FRC06_001645 [Ceratobasidium sp. 370]|nr:hypothetical protein FRC06_001645 [Ceratobasidium sp. 370]
MSEQDTRTFRPLEKGDLKHLLSDITNQQTLGQGHIHLPWYWRVTLSEGLHDSSPVPLLNLKKNITPAFALSGSAGMNDGGDGPKR